MQNYIVNQLNEIVDTKLISFHMPGHKLGKIYDLLGYKEVLQNIYKMDTTEIMGTDNLHSPEGVIKKSQERASKLFKSKKTYYLIDGSTSGIQASILAICKPGDKIIVNRDCHQSVISACILGDIEPVYIHPQIDDKTNILQGVKPQDAIDIINNNLEAKAILLTYPTYYGFTYDLEQIANYAHSKNIIVIVDEAHGSHLGLSGELPDTALGQSADIVIQSTHKTLPAFTQASMLHIQGNRIDEERLSTMLRMIESSSPSYILLSSLELAVDVYEKQGIKLMKKLLANIDEFKEKFNNNELVNIHNEFDKTKIFIECSKLGITGYELDSILREKYNIQVELGNYYGVLLICTIGNEQSDFSSLEKALSGIIREYDKKQPITNISYPNEIPKKILSPREAFYKDKKSVKIEKSIGEICGENIIPYPPGISLISPGEVITKEVIDYILLCSEKGMNVSGMKDTDLKYIQIIKNK